MFEAFEKAFDGIIKICLKAHLESNPPGSEETWVAKCGRIFGGAMKKNFPKTEEDISKLPHWDTYIICTLLKEYLQTVSWFDWDNSIWPHLYYNIMCVLDF